MQKVTTLHIHLLLSLPEIFSLNFIDSEWNGYPRKIQIYLH